MRARTSTVAAEIRTVRDRIWAAIRKLGSFTLLDLHREARVGDRSIQKYLRGLQAAGYIEKRAVFVLARDVGVHAPRVDELGREITGGKRVENMWRAVRILRAFSAPELLAAASMPESAVSLQHARNFITLLRRKGFIERVGMRGKYSPGRYRAITARCRGQRPPVEERAR